MEVLAHRAGTHTGLFERPANWELQQTFGTTDFAEIFRFMLEKGSVKRPGQHSHIHRKDIIYPDKNTRTSADSTVHN